MNVKYAPVAQLDRVSDSDSEGRAFESHQAYQIHILRPSPWGMSKRNRGIAQQVEQRSPKPRVPSSSLGAPAKEKVLSDSDKTFFISPKKRTAVLFCRNCTRTGRLLFSENLQNGSSLKPNFHCQKFSLSEPAKNHEFSEWLPSHLPWTKTNRGIPFYERITENANVEQKNQKARFRQTEERDYSGKSTSSNTVLLI